MRRQVAPASSCVVWHALRRMRPVRAGHLVGMVLLLRRRLMHANRRPVRLLHVGLLSWHATGTCQSARRVSRRVPSWSSARRHRAVNGRAPPSHHMRRRHRRMRCGVLHLLRLGRRAAHRSRPVASVCPWWCHPSPRWTDSPPCSCARRRSSHPAVGLRRLSARPRHCRVPVGHSTLRRPPRAGLATRRLVRIARALPAFSVVDRELPHARVIMHARPNARSAWHQTTQTKQMEIDTRHELVQTHLGLTSWPPKRRACDALPTICGGMLTCEFSTGF